MILTILLLSLSISLDAFGIGMSYGMRGIAVPVSARLIISMQSVLITATSLYLGRQLSAILPPQLTQYLGVGLLLAMGIAIIVQGATDRPADPEPAEEGAPDSQPSVHQFFIRCFGITIQIIRQPATCDLNHSNRIDPKEALYLGFALSIDAFGAGLGTGASGLVSPIFPLSVAAFQFMLLLCGQLIGSRLQTRLPFGKRGCSLFSGSILIGIGLLRIL